jgi:ubiquinone/menaquinone biosynthesis C-methylase UbiE
MQAWRRLAGKGIYPVEYASWLVSPLRYLVSPPGRIVGRLGLSPTDHILEIGCGPGFFSPTIAEGLPAGHLTLFDTQDAMLELAATRLKHRGFANFTCVCGNAASLPFRNGTFDKLLLVTVLGEISDKASAMAEAARVIRPNGCLSLTEAAGDPDRLKPTELDQLGTQAGLAKDKSWRGLLIQTHHYRKPATPNS